jgi:membrane protein implicated in regulation of membrane protease activity
MPGYSRVELAMKFLKNNGLTIVLLVATVITLLGMLMTGLSVYNDDLTKHGAQAVEVGEYLTTGHFLSALFENWESEFLQMSAYVVLTAFLFQRGSAESKDPNESSPQDADPAGDENKPDAPLPVRMGGLPRSLYSYSLGLALFLLFVVSFVLHLRESLVAEAVQARLHGEPEPAIADHLSSAQLWFESFQNWQSEFLSTAVLVVLSIFLRFRGSPESKPVSAPHSQTGA